MAELGALFLGLLNEDEVSIRRDPRADPTGESGVFWDLLFKSTTLFWTWFKFASEASREWWWRSDETGYSCNVWGYQYYKNRNYVYMYICTYLYNPTKNILIDQTKI